MSFNSMRVYDAERFHDVDFPDWYHEAEHLSETERIDFHQALDRVLDCEYTLLTDDSMTAGGIEIRFWPSEMQGIFVLIETPLAFVEQIVVLNPTDWLPFLTRYLAPLMTASSQSAMIALHGKVGNAFIALARHGEGTHVDRATGLSRIDLDNDRNRRLAERARMRLTQANKDAGK